MREILNDVLLENLPEAIKKLPIPGNVPVRVTIETLEEPLSSPDSADLRFLEAVERLPVADDLPQDLAHQHDHYLYGLPKKP